MASRYIVRPVTLYFRLIEYKARRAMLQVSHSTNTAAICVFAITFRIETIWRTISGTVMMCTVSRWPRCCGLYTIFITVITVWPVPTVRLSYVVASVIDQVIHHVLALVVIWAGVVLSLTSPAYPVLSAIPLIGVVAVSNISTILDVSTVWGRSGSRVITMDWIVAGSVSAYHILLLRADVRETVVQIVALTLQMGHAPIPTFIVAGAVLGVFVSVRYVVMVRGAQGPIR